MSNTANAHPNNDPWASSSNSNQALATRRKGAIKSSKHIPDAWDDDDDADEGEEAVEADNAKLWRDANSKQPMPEVILTASSTSSVPAPPPVALQQSMRILKRPSVSTSTSSSSITSAGSSGTPTSLRDREAAYLAARKRIFGGPGQEEGERGDGTSEESATNGVQETRERLKAVSLSGGNPSSPIPPVSSSAAQPSVSVSVSRNPRGPPLTSSSSSSSVSTTTSTNGSSRHDKGSVTEKGFAKRRGSAGGSGGKGRGGSPSTQANAKS